MERELKVTPQMLNARRGHLAAVLSFGQNERALDGGLRVERQALRSSLRRHASLAHGFFYIRDKDPRVAGDAAVAGLTQGRMRVVDLLHHSSCQAGEVGQFAAQQSLTKRASEPSIQYSAASRASASLLSK